jgi:hypothetical protein
MFPRTLEAPMGSDWTDIYMYLGGLYVKKMGRDIPDDIKTAELSNYQMGLLNQLKHWIFERRIKARKERERVERRKDGEVLQEEPEPAKEPAPEPLFLFK